MTAAAAVARPALAILAGALLLAWPACLNGYPLLFSDTGAFLAQTLTPLMIWDKPWIYGPLLHLFHWRLTLWLPLAAQALMMSHLLWLTQRALTPAPSPLRHLALTAATAALTTAPFTIALLMPDLFAPVTVLALFLLGFTKPSRAESLYLTLLASLGIAAHLSHLPLAAALIALAALLTRRLPPTLRMVAPLAIAIALLLTTNLIGHRRFSLSPHGATFLLARLQDDGPATRTLRAECPARGWYLCAFLDRLPMDSDEFLWLPDSPVNRDAGGAPRFLGGAMLSPEAGAIIAETLRREPFGVARAMLANWLRQLTLAEAGDTLGPDIDNSPGRNIRAGFPAAEIRAFERGLQHAGTLPAAMAPFLWPHLTILILAALLLPYAVWRAPSSTARAFLLMVVLGIAANAFATGALSKPHHRYEARIAWLLPFAVALTLSLRRRPA